MTQKKHALLSALVILLMAIVLPAKCAAEHTTQKSQTLPIRIETNLVTIRAVFVDSRGRRITNLTASDIVVTDDGKPQELTTFQTPGQPSKGHAATSVRSEETELSSLASSDRAELEVLILILGMEFANRHYALQAVARYLEGEHNGLTRVAVADFTGATLPFTSQQQELTDFAKSLVRLPVPANGIFESPRFRQSTASLCESMKERPGRKAIVLFSDFYRVPNPIIWTSQPGDVLPIALDIGAPVYPVDARGVVPVTPLGDASSDVQGLGVAEQLSFQLMTEQGEFAYMAFLTGGQNLPGNDLGAPFKEMERDTSSSYVLEYYKHGLKLDGAFHSIKVSCKRRGIHVRARAGYFAPVKGIEELDARRQLQMALASDRPFRDIRVQFRPYFFPYTRSGEPFTVTVLGMAFKWTSRVGDSHRAGPLSVIGTIQSPGAGIENFSNQAMSREVSEQGASSAPIWETTMHTPLLKLPAGDNVIKVAARSATGELGSAGFRFSIPAEKTESVMIGSLVISQQVESLKVQQTEAIPDDPWIVGNQRIVPQASNEFKSRDELTFYTRVTKAGREDPLSAILLIKDVTGTTVAGPVSQKLGEPNGSSFGTAVLFRMSASDFSGAKGPLLAALSIKENSTTMGSVGATFAVSREEK